MSHPSCSLITLCLDLFQNFSNETLSLGVSWKYHQCQITQIFFQLFNLILQQKLHYFGIDNLMDMFCYVTSLLVLSIIVISIQVSKHALFGIHLF